MYDLALHLLGSSASRDTTGVHIVTSVGKTQNTEEAYQFLLQASLLGHKRAMELVAWGQLLGPLPLDIESAVEKFQTLGSLGYPNSQMVIFYALLI